MSKLPLNLAAASDLKNGEMKQIEAEGKTILLARIGDRFHATSAECPHYGAPLAEGLLCGDRVICPWHKSVFRITDGALLDPPALEGLKHYDVFVEDERVYLRWPESEEPSPRPSNPQDQRCFLIAGAGAASTAAAENLRALGSVAASSRSAKSAKLPTIARHSPKNFSPEKSVSISFPCVRRSFGNNIASNASPVTSSR